MYKGLSNVDILLSTLHIYISYIQSSLVNRSFKFPEKSRSPDELILNVPTYTCLRFKRCALTEHLSLFEVGTDYEANTFSPCYYRSSSKLRCEWAAVII